MNDDNYTSPIFPNIYTFTAATPNHSRFPGSVARKSSPHSERKTCRLEREHILNYVTDFLQQAHSADERYTVRDGGINIARFAAEARKSPEDGSRGGKHADERFLLRTAVIETLGDEASRYVPRS